MGWSHHRMPRNILFLFLSSTFPSELKRRFRELWNYFSTVNILSDVLVHVPKEAHSQHKYLIWTFYISTFQLAVKSIPGPAIGDAMETVPSLLLSYYVTWARKATITMWFFVAVAQPVRPLTTAERQRASQAPCLPSRCCLSPRGRSASSIKLGVIRASLLQLPRRVGINVKQN